ncbi:MAG: fasciclin domain-containing protein [Cyanobacteria bacterium J06642_2]
MNVSKTSSFVRHTLLAAIGIGMSIALGSSLPSMAGQREAPPSEVPELDTDNSADIAQSPDSTSESDTTAENTIVDVAIAAGSFNTLTQALEAADLVETLQSAGPFTVFAPTDEAFEALPEGTLEDLLLPENKEQLVQILTYHVVPGAVQSGDLVDGDVTTVEGSAIAVTTGDRVTINDAEVLQPDIDASNGVIHVIDAVLLPSS